MGFKPFHIAACLALTVSALLPIPLRAYDWPGSTMSYLDGETPLLEFRGNIITMQDKATGATYTAFEGNLNGSEWGHNNNSGVYHSIFLVSGDTDKSTVAAVLTAYSTGMRFKVQFERHTVFNRPVMLVRAFQVAR